MADIAVRVDGLEKWRDGNGKPGAAAMIADHEKRIERETTRNDCQDSKLAEIDKAQAIAEAMAKQIVVDAVSEALKKRGQSREGRIRAWGPYFAAFCALLASLATVVFGA